MEEVMKPPVSKQHTDRCQDSVVAMSYRINAPMSVLVCIDTFLVVCLNKLRLVTQQCTVTRELLHRKSTHYPLVRSLPII